MKNKLAKLEYLPNNFKVLEDGDYVICSVTGNEEATNTEIKKKYSEIIDECKTNEILFQFNGNDIE